MKKSRKQWAERVGTRLFHGFHHTIGFIEDHWEKLLFGVFFLVVTSVLAMLTIQMVTPHRGLATFGVSQIMAIPPDEPIVDGMLSAKVVWVTQHDGEAFLPGAYVAVQTTDETPFYWIEQIVSYDVDTHRLVTSFDGVIARTIDPSRVIGNYVRRSENWETISYFSTQPVGFSFIAVFLMLSLYTAHRALITKRA